MAEVFRESRHPCVEEERRLAVKSRGHETLPLCDGIWLHLKNYPLIFMDSPLSCYLLMDLSVKN